MRISGGRVVLVAFLVVALVGTGVTLPVVRGSPSAASEGLVRPLAPVAAPRPGPAPSSDVSATGAQRMLTLLQTFRSQGLPTGDIHLPDLAAASYGHAALVSPTYSQAPAPMGVADLGVRNISGTLHGSTSYTSSAMGRITLDNASAVYVDGDGPDMFGIQLDSVLVNVTVAANATYQYWTQNFVSYTPSSGWLAFGDNVWNFSSHSGFFPASSLNLTSSNGSLADSIVYYAVGPSFTVHYPFTLTFYNNASLVGGQSAVYFNYTVASTSLVRSGSFDRVVFNSNVSRLHGPARTPAFQVKGTSTNPIGLLNDIELDVVGNDDGDTTVFTAVNATLSIATWSATTHAFVPVASAYNAGVDTGETSTGLAVFWDGSGPVARMVPGPSFLTGLWNVSGYSGERHVALNLTPANAFVLLSPGPSFNASRAQWAPATSSPLNFSFPNGGNYTLRVELSDFDPATVALNGSANSTTYLNVSLSADPTEGIYTPLYAWSNAELAALSTSGNGSATSPYVLENTQTASLDPEFAQWNDFEFPVFSGILLVHTTAWVTITPPSFALTYPAWQQPTLKALGQPLSNNLQLLFDNVSHVALVNGPGITGWLPSSLSAYPVGAVVFWNSSDNLLAGNHFDDEGGAVALFGGTNNTVWGNWFLSTSANASHPANLYDAGANETALNLSEDGDLVYDNAFLTPIDAITPTQNALDCQVRCEPARYTDTWNISRSPTSAYHLDLGVNLTGSIIGTDYQGGNYWWNYGTLSDPFDALPYNDSGLITVGGDFVPLSYATLYTVTFQETGLAPGLPWSVSTEGVTRNSTTDEISLASPDGTYPYTVGPVAGYTAPTGKTFTVSGANLTVSLTYRLDYAVTFTPVGLPATSTWSITVSSAVRSPFTGSAGGTSPIVAPLDNGSYTYAVGAVDGYTPSPSRGSFNVTGGPYSTTVHFRLNINATYSVTFVETGLTNNTTWAVMLGTVQTNSHTPSISVSLPNGTYNFSVVPVAGYTSLPSTNISVEVQGQAPPPVAVTFTAVTTPTYPVTFRETGLVPGTAWSLVVSGAEHGSTNASFVVVLAPGLYAVEVTPIAHYAQSETSFVLDVTGATSAPVVTFIPVGAVTVLESGLASGAAWQWVVAGPNGSASGSGNGSDALEDGTYGFVVSASGYKASPATDTFQVEGFNTTFVNVTFTALASPSPTPTPTPATNSTPTDLTPYYAVIVGLAVLGAVLLFGLLYYYRRANAPPPPPPTPYEAGTSAPAPGTPPPSGGPKAPPSS